MNKIDEIALRVTDRYDPRENYFPYRNDLILYVKELLAELSKDAEPYAFEIETENNFGGFDKWVTTDTKHYMDLCDRGEPRPLFTHPAPVIASEQKPVAKVISWTNGSYHRNYKISWLGDVDEGTDLFTSPPNTAAIEQRVAEAYEQGKRDAVPEGYTLVPTEILDRFPEINPSNYDHDDACALNAWGVELVLATAPKQEK